jgi:membrane protein required for colicin V production
MNWTDYIIIGVLALSVFVGLWRGLISEVLALAIWVAAFWVAWTLGPAVAGRLEHVIELPSARIIVGYGLCFIAVLVLGALLRFVIGRLVESTGLSGTDRLLGMLFGFVRGVLVVTLLVFLVGFTAFTRDPWWRQSVLLPRFQHMAAWLGQQVPPGVREYLHPPATLGRLSGLPVASPAPISGTTPAPAATAMRPTSPAAAGTAGPSRTF